MAISRTQPMRPAEIDLLYHMDSAEGNITQLQEDLEETNRVVGELNSELGQEIVNRQQADIALGNRLDTAEDDIEILQGDFAAIPVFEYGVSENNNVPASSSIGVNIVFTNEKQNTPYVLISIECVESEESPVANCYGIIISASTTGFSVRLHNLDDTNAESININWLAIGA